MQGLKKSPKARGAVLFGLVMVVVASIAAFTGARPEKLLGPDQVMQFDDFAFSFTDVREASTLGQGQKAVQASGKFVIVTLRIDNRAKRVGYTFNPQSAVLLDDHDREYRLSPEGQRALATEGGAGSSCTWPLPAGKACTLEIVYDVPRESGPLRMSLSQGVGGALDDLLLGKRRFQIR